jgi:hypothetical protein
MSDSEPTDRERSSRILFEALDDTDILEGRTSYKWNAYFHGRVEVYWQRQADYPGVDLILDSEGGQIRSWIWTAYHRTLPNYFLMTMTPQWHGKTCFYTY